MTDIQRNKYTRCIRRRLSVSNSERAHLSRFYKAMSSIPNDSSLHDEIHVDIRIWPCSVYAKCLYEQEYAMYMIKSTWNYEGEPCFNLLEVNFSNLLV